MYKIFEIFKQLGNESPEFIILGIDGKIGEEGRKRIGANMKILNTQEYLISVRHYLDIPVNSKFTVVFTKNNPRDFVNINAELKEIYIGRGEKVNVLPEDTHGECLLEFKEGKPELLSKLALWEEEYNPDKNDFLYFTTQSVMDRILELLDE